MGFGQRKDQYAGVIFWNDGPEILERSLKSLKDCGFKIIAIDGIFREMLKIDPSLPTTSTDGCIDVAKKYADLYVEGPKEGWESQVAKRNVYVKETPDGSYFWAIDADEVMRSFNLSREISDDVYRISEHRIMENGSRKTMHTIRTYRKYPDLCYNYQHCRIYRMSQHDPSNMDSGLVVKAQGGKNMTYPVLFDDNNRPVQLDHYRQWRSKERYLLKQKFYAMREEAKYGYN